MKFDVASYLGAVERTVTALDRDGKPARAVRLSRIYKTNIEDLWDALTNEERLPRWFLPVEGDLRPGGRYQLEGNAGGSIAVCDPPDTLSLTWEFGAAISWVDVMLTAESSDATRLELVHTVPVDEHWEKYGPGATGAGWDLGLLGLALHLENPDTRFDESEFAASEDGKSLITGYCEAWADADIASGAEPASARAAARETTAFYTGEAPQDG